MVRPRRPRGLRHRRREREHGEEVPDREGDDQRGREAAPLAPAETAQADLHRPWQETRAAEEAIARALRPDCGSSRLEGLAKIDPDGSPDRRQRGQHRSEHAHGHAGDDHGGIDAEADVDRPEHRPEVPGEEIGEQDPERDPDERAEQPQQRRRPDVHERNLSPACADRAHDPDLAGLLGDERRHRVRDEDAAESSASRVITASRSANACVSALPGQSPGSRSSGRPMKPAKPGTVSR